MAILAGFLVAAMGVFLFLFLRRAVAVVFGLLLTMRLVWCCRGSSRLSATPAEHMSAYAANDDTDNGNQGSDDVFHPESLERNDLVDDLGAGFPVSCRGSVAIADISELGVGNLVIGHRVHAGDILGPDNAGDCQIADLIADP